MRLTRAGKVFAFLVVLTAGVSLVAPTAGLVMAIVVAVVALVALSEGFGGTGAQATHETWAGVEADRKRDALRRGR